MTTAATSIAVFPFHNASQDASQDYFARGFVQDLAIELSRFPTLEVLHPETDNVREDEAAHSLRGSVHKMDDVVRIYAQVIDAAGRQIWSDRFDAPAEQLFEVQNEIVTQVASRLAGKLESDRLRRARRKPLASLEIYDCWLRGMDFLRRGTPEDDAEARVFFERSLTLDPTYARGFAGISLSHFNEWSCQAWEFWDDKERLAFQNARRAAELDDEDALIQLVLGRIFLYRRQFHEAERYVERAVALNPNDADVLAHASMCRGFLGDPAESLSLATKAMRLNPLHPDWYIGSAALALFLLERFGEALILMARTPEATVDLPAYQAAAYALSGDSLNAAHCLKRFLSNFDEKIIFGREPEAGEQLRWLVHVNPFARQEHADLFARGLALAGLRGDSEAQSLASLTPSTGHAHAQSEFRKDGDVWALRFEDLSLRLSDMKGLSDLAELLAHPHEPIHCLDLAGRSAEPATEDAVLDARARRELTARAQALQQQVEEAGSLNDRGRMEASREELEQIVSVLSSAFGLAGKPRRLGGAVERARTAVTWRIRSAIRRTATLHPALGRHLENSVRTGTYCTYAPEKTPDWAL